ncbi:hypothetical protein [Sphingobium chungbukense]|uniref:Uncharacterized protein n=1 Tax=Sphingobium chungbukense TaxID=56193 RepID=A0A0M3AYS9_9SPHN|nr:hypothetical protein [Sphingobium chungbukense]KKW94091.1 hypothetical protein YP76_05680 [Sphingobium chungbukense]
MAEDATCYVFAGVGSEYSLAPLAAFLRKRGRHCIEIDMMRADWRDAVAHALGAKRRILVSSQHPYMNGHHYHIYYGTDLDVLNVPELQGVLQPDRSYFVPHDLLSPIKGSEIVGLTLFDAILMPSDSWWYLSTYVRCENVGWIKAAQDNIPEIARTPLQIAWLPSEIGAWLARPAGLFEEVYRDLLTLRPLFKAPAFPGTQAMIDLAGGAGCQVFDASVQSSVLIDQSHAVVSNGLSSICAEAALRGVPTLCIDDGSVESWYLRDHWQALPGVTVHAPDRAWELLTSWRDHPERIPSRAPSVIAPFDFDKAATIVEAL